MQSLQKVCTHVQVVIGSVNGALVGQVMMVEDTNVKDLLTDATDLAGAKQTSMV